MAQYQYAIYQGEERRLQVGSLYKLLTVVHNVGLDQRFEDEVLLEDVSGRFPAKDFIFLKSYKAYTSLIPVAGRKMYVTRTIRESSDQSVGQLVHTSMIISTKRVGEKEYIVLTKSGTVYDVTVLS